jgi:hypothetical protein
VSVQAIEQGHRRGSRWRRTLGGIAIEHAQSWPLEGRGAIVDGEGIIGVADVTRHVDNDGQPAVATTDGLVGDERADLLRAQLQLEGKETSGRGYISCFEFLLGKGGNGSATQQAR